MRRASAGRGLPPLRAAGLAAVLAVAVLGCAWAGAPVRAAVSGATAPSESEGSAPAGPGAPGAPAAPGAPIQVRDETLVLAPAAGGWRALDTVTFLNAGASAATEVAIAIPGDARDLGRLDSAGPAPAVDFARVLPGSSLVARAPVSLPPGAQATVTVSWTLPSGGPFRWTRPVLYPTLRFTALLPREAGRLSAIGLFPQADETIGGRRLRAMGAVDVAAGSLLTIEVRPATALSRLWPYAAAAAAALLLLAIGVETARRRRARAG